MQRRPWWPLFLLGAVLATGAGGSELGDDLDHNRRMLEKWRADPDHAARLQRDLRAFYALPKSKQEQLRVLDRQLHEGDFRTQSQLWSVLDRYANWLESLPEEKKQQLNSAPTPAIRLAIIREMRLGEWLPRLPERLRERVLKLPLDKQAAEVAKIREEERQQRKQWADRYRSRQEKTLRPARMSDFSGEIQRYLRDKLVPRLSDEEKDRLKKSEGKWPDYARTIRELADLHPVLPPLPSGEIKRWIDLPAEVKRLLSTVDRRAKMEILKKVNGMWPEYALEVTRLLEAEGSQVPPLGACTLDQFPPEIQAFVKNQLLPKLNPAQKERLAKAEGKWPAYPKQLLRVARERRLVIPKMSLPGPPALWENARAKLPAVPDRLLRQFARHELSPEQRAALERELSPVDPMGNLEKVKKAWYNQRQAEEDRRKRRQKTVSAEQR